MVIGTKRTIQHVPSKRHMSIYKIHNFTVQKKQSLVRISYGFLLTILAIVMASINPIQIATNYFMDLREGTFLYNMWESPTYDIITEVQVFNYTNTDEYLSGKSKVLKVKELGPFRFREIRKNHNITIYKDRGVVTMRPESKLEFLREGSVGEMDGININVPNIALLAISTLLADKLGYLANVGAYYSISAMGPKLFREMTVDEFLFGYYDPIVTIANSLLPGWIDFDKIGIMDRFYSVKAGTVELSLNEDNMYSINKWGKHDGIVEQGYTDANTSIPCNTVKGTYEGLMITPGFPKGKLLKIYKQQACRVYPFEYTGSRRGPYGFDLNSYAMQLSAFSRNSTFDCKCQKKSCLPEGFVDVGGCYYGFPIALSHPHFLAVDPVQKSYFEGMKPDPKLHISHVDIEPTLGVPVSLSSMIQVNIAVRMSSGNTITKPLKDKVLPLLWITMSCKAPPPKIINILRLRLVIAPPLVITIEVVLLLIGIILGVQGGYRMWKPRYKLIEPQSTIIKSRRKKTSYPINMSDNKGFKNDDDLAKEAVSLLSMKYDDSDVPDLLIET